MGVRDDPVFIDGRLEVVGEEFYAYYRGALASEEALERCVARYGIGWIVFPYATNPRLTRMLDRSRRGAWSTSTTWPRSSSQGGRLPAHVGRREREGAPRGGEPLPPRPISLGSVVTRRRSRVGGWLRGLVTRESFPSSAMGRRAVPAPRGPMGTGGRGVRAAVREGDGAYYEIYNNLGSASFRVGRLRDARRCYEIVCSRCRETRGRSIACGRSTPPWRAGQSRPTVADPGAGCRRLRPCRGDVAEIRLVLR